VRSILSLSGRYDDHVGLYTTTNPHFALGWESLPGVTLRANYSTSFVAPQLSSDLGPSFLPHLHSNFALFNANLSNQVSGSSASNDINSVALHDNLTFFPSGATAAQIAQYTYGYPQLSAIAPTIYYVLSVRGQNLLNLYVQGVDADARYDVPTAAAGTFRVGGSMTYFTKFNQNIAGGPPSAC
jgi:outer membrane receptor protein involved in Fe transport